jgi:hypothetical protein
MQARIAELVQFLSAARYSSFMVSRLVLETTKLPIQCVPEALSSGIKFLGHVADNSLHLVLRSRTVELHPPLSRGPTLPFFFFYLYEATVHISHVKL